MIIEQRSNRLKECKMSDCCLVCVQCKHVPRGNDGRLLTNVFGISARAAQRKSQKQDLRRDYNAHGEVSLLPSKRQQSLGQPLRPFREAFPCFIQILWMKDQEVKPLVHRNRTDLVRFVKNDNLAAVDARPVEQLEYDLEQRASGTGADEPMPKGKATMSASTRRLHYD